MALLFAFGWPGDPGLKTPSKTWLPAHSPFVLGFCSPLHFWKMIPAMAPSFTLHLLSALPKALPAPALTHTVGAKAHFVQNCVSHGFFCFSPSVTTSCLHFDHCKMCVRWERTSCGHSQDLVPEHSQTDSPSELFFLFMLLCLYYP